jgi:hypothetical protein
LNRGIKRLKQQSNKQDNADAPLKTILVDAVHAFIIKEEGIFQPMYELLETYPNPKIILTNAGTEEQKKF